MKKSGKLFLSVLFVMLLVCVSCVLCSCKTTEVNNYYGDYALYREFVLNDWSCDDFTIIQSEPYFELTVDGNTYYCETIIDVKGMMTVFDYGKRTDESNKFIYADSGSERIIYPQNQDFCIWDAKYAVEDGVLTITVSKDGLFSRGETQTDYTGREFVLTKLTKAETEPASTTPEE